jgi:hypothetical protein
MSCCNEELFTDKERRAELMFGLAPRKGYFDIKKSGTQPCLDEFSILSSKKRGLRNAIMVRKV